MELTAEDKTLIINLLLQISLPVKDAPTVIAVINKLQAPVEVVKEDSSETL